MNGTAIWRRLTVRVTVTVSRVEKVAAVDEIVIMPFVATPEGAVKRQRIRGRQISILLPAARY